MKIYKRYQYYSLDGIKWTKWFEISIKYEQIKWQLKSSKLKNEYKIVEDESN